MFTSWNITSLEKGKAQDLVARYDDQRKELAIIDPENNTQIVIFVDNPREIKKQINYILDSIIKLNSDLPKKSNIKSSFMEKIRQKFPNAYKKWDERDDKKLQEMFNQNIPVREIATFFKRKNSAIRSRLIKKGLINE